jgi:hypothetical protein
MTQAARSKSAIVARHSSPLPGYALRYAHLVSGGESGYLRKGPWPDHFHFPRSRVCSRAASYAQEKVNMDLNSIRNALREQPFRPFELWLADGRRVPVHHPEFVAMNNRVVVVLDEESFSKTIEPLLIVSIEPLSEPAKGGNGTHKKRRKP